MTIDNFDKAMAFFGYKLGDRKHVCLKLVLVDGASQVDASRATGYSQPQLSTVIRRVRRDLDRVKALTGVDVCE